MPTNAIRRFTPSEAERTLPLVRRIVADILATGQRIRELRSQRKEQDSRKLIAALEALIAELEQLGCQYKDWDFTIGLVDFPSVIDGKDVLLCWRSDEPGIRFFHGYDDGYAGRRPIPSDAL